ncbi:MAG: glycosyltransferase family 2 protein [Thermodesulfobacteriota bacterium]|nr:glycosyltransferase family 2 protein [Thermodesulfobacteriota bacterium]
MDLSIVIPMFNEAENVDSTLKRVEEAMSSFQGTYEIIAVNDGSADNTLEVLQEIADRNKRTRVVSYLKNIGRGMALRRGFIEAKGEIVVSIDADLSYDPGYIPDFIETLRNEPDVDFVLASPYMPGGGVRNVPFVRLWISKIGNMVLRHAMPNRIHTSTGIFRAYRRKVLDSLELESDGKEIHLEILSKALALGFRTKEVPAILSGRKKGKSKFKFKKTATSHLIFSIFEKPMIIFGFLGLLTLGVGLLIGIYIAYLRFSGDLTPGRPLITFAILLILGGIQILSFGFIAIQIVSLRREILRIQKENLELRNEIRKPGMQEKD